MRVDVGRRGTTDRHRIVLLYEALHLPLCGRHHGETELHKDTNDGGDLFDDNWRFSIHDSCLSVDVCCSGRVFGEELSKQ